METGGIPSDIIVVVVDFCGVASVPGCDETEASNDANEGNEGSGVSLFTGRVGTSSGFFPKPDVPIVK